MGASEQSRAEVQVQVRNGLIESRGGENEVDFSGKCRDWGGLFASCAIEQVIFKTGWNELSGRRNLRCKVASLNVVLMHLLQLRFY